MVKKLMNCCTLCSFFLLCILWNFSYVRMFDLNIGIEGYLTLGFGSGTSKTSNSLKSLITSNENDTIIYVRLPEFGHIILVATYSYNSNPNVVNELVLKEFLGIAFTIKNGSSFFLDFRLGGNLTSLTDDETLIADILNLSGRILYGAMEGLWSSQIVDCSVCRSKTITTFGNRKKTVFNFNHIGTYYLIPVHAAVFDGVGWMIRPNNSYGVDPNIIGGGFAVIVTDPVVKSEPCKIYELQKSPYSIPGNVTNATCKSDVCNFFKPYYKFLDIGQPAVTIAQIGVYLQNEGSVVVACYAGFDFMNRLIQSIRNACIMFP